MKTLGTYPLYVFNQQDRIEMVYPNITMTPLGDSDYQIDITVFYGADKACGMLILSKEQMDRELDAILQQSKQVHLKSYYLQDFESVAYMIRDLIQKFDVKHSWKRSNVLFLADDRHYSTLFTYLNNDKGKLSIEALVFSNHGEPPALADRNATMLINGLLYPVTFSPIIKTISRPDTKMRTFICKGELLNLFTVKSVIDTPSSADREAHTILHYLEDRMAQTTEPDISAFLKIQIKRPEMLDLEL